MIPRVTKHLMLFFFISSAIFAQFNLEVSNPQALWYRYRGTIDEATISVGPKGVFSQVSTYLTFSAKGTSFPTSSQLEIVLRFDLPEGSFVTDLWLWIGDKISKGVILDTWTASSIYEGIVNRRRDPAILMKKGPRSYELRVYPLLPGGSRKVRITYLVPNNWSTNSVSIPLPLEILKTTANKIQNVNLVTWKNSEWDNPRVTSLSGLFTEKSDTFYGDHLEMPLQSYDSFSSMNLEFNNPMVNGVFLKVYKKTNEGYYQLSLFPNASLTVAKKKVLFLIDYDSRKSNATRKQVLDGIKSMLKTNFAVGDQFNIFYSGLNIGKASNNWLGTDSATIEATFYKVTENSLSTYSNLPTLLKEGYDYIIKNNGGVVYFVSNSDQVGSYQTANQLLADIKNIMTSNVPTYILDFNDREFTYYYFSNRSFIGNEYFYDNLARMTAGVYSHSTSNLSGSMNDLAQRISGTLTSFDLYTTLDNGFCYSRQSLGRSNQGVYLNQPVTQLGKFVGDFPFVIKTSGIYNTSPFTQTMVFQDQQSLLTDNITEKMWVSSYISSLENGPMDNSKISEIVNLSMTNRVLSKYTAFLSVESDTAYCSDCYNDNGNFTDVKQDQEIPTEFSLDAYPNPFNSQVIITVKLSSNMSRKNLTFKIYNILGQVVKTFTVDESSGSIIKLKWDGMNDGGQVAASGVYIFTVSGSGFTKSLKLMYVK
ncbi:MAG: T9SS type A sorting domain-containing protein [Bacteroidetes bacterium]|nr:T9SS type A sorting domain-containing protein [Bacteroidota bacterium]MCL6100660.1 T9SS type A sorting domain-containing protein [Bacteroidota bacterium]